MGGRCGSSAGRDRRGKVRARQQRGGAADGTDERVRFSGALLLELFGAPWCIIGVLFAAPGLGHFSHVNYSSWDYASRSRLMVI